MRIKDKLIKSIPNILTIMRIVISIIGARMFVIKNVLAAVIWLGFGAVTDFLDGFAARRLNATSEFGKKLDAISDKIYALCLLVPSILCGNLLMGIPLVFELAIGSINFKAYKLKFNPATHRIGKFKTASLFPTLIVGLLATLNLEFYFILIPLLALTTCLHVRTLTIYENQFYNNVEMLIKNTYRDGELEKENDTSISRGLEKNKPRIDDKPLNAIGQPKFSFVYNATNYVGRNIENLVDEGARYLMLPIGEIDDTPAVTAEKKRALIKELKTLSRQCF